VILLDPSLGAAGGHHATVAANYRRLLSGRRVLLIGNRRGDADVPLFPYRIEDAFRVSRYASVLAGPAPLARVISGVVNMVRRRRRTLPGQDARGGRAVSLEDYVGLFRLLQARTALQRLWRDIEIGAMDDLVCLGADPALLCALWRERERLLGARAPRVYLLFMYPEEDFVGRRVEAAYWSVARDVAALAAGLFAELELHATELSGRLQRPVAAQITPVRLEGLGGSPASPFIVVVLGAGRWDKAFDALPAIVEATRARDPSIAFRIQGPERRSGLESAARALAAAPNVILLPERLGDASYEQELQACSVALLAYDEKRYARRNSGFLVDALAAGRPIVCARAPAFAAAAAHGNGLLASSPEEFAEALVAVKARHQTVADAARAYASDIRLQMADGPLLRALREA
jgi:glycosyltransferase involved in cell wall biosynthesis